MDKRAIAAIVVLVVLLTLFTVEYIRYKHSMNALEDALIFLRSGRYAEGLARCHEMHYYTSICYSTLLGLKLGGNQTITQENCAGFVDDSPFWSSSDGYKDLRVICDCLATGNSKETCSQIRF